MVKLNYYIIIFHPPTYLVVDGLLIQKNILYVNEMYTSFILHTWDFYSWISLNINKNVHLFILL